MAPTPWTRAQLQARVFADLGQQDSADNELLTEAQVQDALAIAERQFAQDARALRRTATLTAVSGQAGYAAPEDLFAIVDVTVGGDTTPLRATDEGNLARHDAGYRQEAASLPRYWYPTHPGRFGLYPPPDASVQTLTVDGYCAPLNVGGGIDGITRDGSTVTAATVVPHHLRVGDSVVISGCTDNAYNGAWSVTDMPTTTTFTFSHSTGGTVDDSGAISYAGGCLPMLDDGDVPPYPLSYRPALAFYAVFWLSRLQLRSDPQAQDAGQAAFTAYVDLVRRYLGETAI
ncbi:MAG: phage adaptor protein [Armatimonadota bacterium]